MRDSRRAAQLNKIHRKMAKIEARTREIPPAWTPATPRKKRGLSTADKARLDKTTADHLKKQSADPAQHKDLHAVVNSELRRAAQQQKLYAHHTSEKKKHAKGSNEHRFHDKAGLDAVRKSRSSLAEADRLKTHLPPGYAMVFG